MSGTRLIDLPQLGPIDDDSAIVGGNAGTGKFTAAQIKDYVLGAVGENADLIEVIGKVEALDAELAAEVAKILALTGVVTVQGQQLGTQGSAITALQSGKASSSALTAVQTKVVSLETGQTLIQNDVTDLKSTTATQASSLLSLSTTVGSHTNSISTLQSTDASQANSISTLTSTVGGFSSSIQTLQNVNATMGATYAVKTDVNGFVVGYGITNDGTTSGNQIRFRTDRFTIEGTGGSGGGPVFEAVGGVVYIRNAVIGTGRVVADNLGANSVTDLQLARDMGEYQPNGSAITTLTFGFGMAQAGSVLVNYSAQVDQPNANLDGSIKIQDWRVEAFLNGASFGAREGVTRGPVSFSFATAIGAGFHTVRIDMYAPSVPGTATKIKDQNIGAMMRWR